MANADKKHFGAGVRNKAAGTGGMEDDLQGEIEENMILSNRDKAQHSDQRGLDSKSVQIEQLRDNADNRAGDKT